MSRRRPRTSLGPDVVADIQNSVHRRERKIETFDGHTDTWIVMMGSAENGFCVTDY